MKKPFMPWAAALVAAVPPAVTPPTPPPPSPTKAAPLTIVLVDAATVTPTRATQWRQEGFNAVAVILDEQTSEPVYRQVGRRIADAGLALYCWIEVGRNPALATAHPRWMAALGVHPDWRKDFPKTPKPDVDEVAKAFPWVPIRYREAFDAHLARIDQLLERAPPGWRGILLNDLQGGPSSCGCGNLQCRWATDYHVTSTATRVDEDNAAARFVAEIRRRVGDKTVIPVWTIECEEVDLPADKREGRAGTGFCGTVGCATATCPQVFSRQTSALTSDHPGLVGLLALHTQFRRTRRELGGGPGWVTNVIAYLNKTMSAHGGREVSPARLCVVVEGSLPAEEAEARNVAATAGVGAVIVARTRIDQSYEPRMVRAR